MRKVIWGAAVSLDLYLAGPGEMLDWLQWSDDDAGLSKIRTFIFSRTVAAAPAGAALVGGDPAAFVRQLKQEEGGDIMVMGGGELASALIEGGVVDEIGLNVHPLLLGGGIPFFRPLARRVALTLVEARPIAKDCVFMRYRLA